MTSISIIVVSQDNRKHVARLLRSLAIYRYFEGEIHLIDNASVDGTAEEACAAGVDGIALTVVRRRVRRPLPENRNLARGPAEATSSSSATPMSSSRMPIFSSV